jgi:protoporphyrinogen oxidase
VVAARELVAKGYGVDLIERAPHLGGLQRSETIDGRTFDIGAFSFPESHNLLRTFPEVKSICVNAPYRSYALRNSGRWDGYPISLEGFLKEHGIAELMKAWASRQEDRRRYAEPKTVEEFICRHTGHYVYEESGLRQYIERLYRLPVEDISIDFAHQRLGTLERYGPMHLVRRFWRSRRPDQKRPQSYFRPREGFQKMYERIGEVLTSLGVHVETGTQIESIERAGAEFKVKVAGEAEPRMYGCVFSTVPIPVALKLAALTPHAEFPAVVLHSLYYRGRFRRDAPNFLFNFTRSGDWKRIANFGAIYGTDADGESWFTVEVTAFPKAEEPARLAADFETHADSYGLFERTPELIGHRTTPNAYPVLRWADREAQQTDRNRLAHFGMVSVGRQGNFEYLSSDRTAQRAGEAVGRLASATH